MRRLAITLLLMAACDQGRGERCNPLEYSNSGTAGNCGSGLACVYPTGPTCGVAYCCAVDSSGNITDKNPNCQPKADEAAACMIDLGSPADGSTTD